MSVPVSDLNPTGWPPETSHYDKNGHEHGHAAGTVPAATEHKLFTMIPELKDDPDQDTEKSLASKMHLPHLRHNKADAQSIARFTISDAPLVPSDDAAKQPRPGETVHKPSLVDRVFHHGNADETHEKRKSISDSGPFTVVRNPETGHYITQKNPHWPEEDSWKRENERSGRGDDKVVVPGGIGGVSYF